MKEWYDGYRFGDADIYCPWDVINRVDDLCDTPEAEPKCYWINSSGNALVKRFVSIANRTTQDEIERLIAGEPIEKSLRLDLTYDETDKSIDNIWSVLFTTGYLTQVGMTEQGVYKLVIPNKEVRTVYISQIQEWFKQKIAGNAEQMTSKATAIPLALDGGLRQPKVRYYCILMAWEHGKLKTGTNTYYNIKLQYQDI